MQNFVKHGDNVTVTFPYASAAGGAVLVGAALFGVAQTATAQDAPGALLTTGVYSLPKTAAGNVYVAVATRAALAGDGTVYARLNGVVA